MSTQIGGAGFEPACPEENGFTVRRNRPLCHPPKIDPSTVTPTDLRRK